MVTWGKKIERNDCVLQYGQNVMYSFWKKRIKNLGKSSVYNIPQHIFSGIQREFNTRWMRELIIDKALSLKLPFRLGEIRMAKEKTWLRIREDGSVDKRRLPVDWGRTKQKWAEIWPDLTYEQIKQKEGKPLVFITNEHSDGYRYSILWDKKFCNVTNSRVYNFVPDRANHRYIAKVIKEHGGVDCYEMFRKRKRKRRKYYRKVKQ
jgi:hypothetical protein